MTEQVISITTLSVRSLKVCVEVVHCLRYEAYLDPDAAVYYLARMIKGGEDPLFIARYNHRFVELTLGGWYVRDKRH
jgi:predicted aminopeptidase